MLFDNQRLFYHASVAYLASGQSPIASTEYYKQDQIIRLAYWYTKHGENLETCAKRKWKGETYKGEKMGLMRETERSEN